MRLLTLIAVVALTFAVTPALADKGGNGGGNGNGGNDYTGTGSIALNESSVSLGSTVTFSTSYPHNAKNPRLDVRCYQNGALVYAEAGTPDHAFLLGGASSDWLRAGGPANCTARLWDLIWNGNNPQEVIWLASTGFDAAG